MYLTLKRFLVLIVLFWIDLFVIYSQQLDYIRGKVIDSKTSEPLSYATIRLKYNQIGVFTNAEGDFRVLNNPVFQSDSLIVTCIGYYRLSIAFDDLVKTEINNLKLVRIIYGLTEVTVIARKRTLSSEAIVSRAIRDINKNCPVKPFSYVSYYRDYQKDSSGYLNLNEAIIQTLDTGFSNHSDLNRYRLLDFKQNMDFRRINISPYYDLPESGHSDIHFKRIPYATVGDQYGNEFFILLVHDAIRNFDKKSFSFVDILMQDFVRNHVFSEPVKIYEGNTLLYKINFTSRRQIRGTIAQANGAIFIQPNDFSIHRFEYSCLSLNSEQMTKNIFNIEIEYGHEPALDSKMCLKYISFNNAFIVPDPSDNNFLKVVKSEWVRPGGPYIGTAPTSMTILTYFNRRIDPVSGGRIENYDLHIGKRKAEITKIKVSRDTVYITVKDDKFKYKELDSCNLSIKNVKDIYGNIFNKRKDIEFRQYRELFVQECNKPLEFQRDCYLKYSPLEQNCISHSISAAKFWMNSPLKANQ